MMLIRVVRMHFRPEALPAFEALFRESYARIRGFAGCHHLELLADADDPCVRITYSHWADAAALEHYRQSAFFRETWARTRVLFSEKPLAFSAWPLRPGAA